MDPLYYSGTIVENGAPVNGTRVIIVNLWGDAQSAEMAQRKCQTVTPAVMVKNGRFRVPLEAPCLAAFRENTDLWVEVLVNSESLGRRKVGAVPYAVNAGHAADVPAWAYLPPSSLVTVTPPFTGADKDWRNNAAVSPAKTWVPVPQRALAFVKRFEASKLKITFQDTLGTLAANYENCNWRIVLDGKTILQFSDADGDLPATAWKMTNAAHVAWATAPAGNHKVEVQNQGGARGTWVMGMNECLTGWNTGAVGEGGFLSVEELP
jgi:hypothetical protein